MRAMSQIAAVTLCAVLAVAGAGGDHPSPVAPPGGDARAAAPSTPAAVPRFALFGWVSPPPESTTAYRYDELAGAGLNVTQPALEDQGRRGDNLRRLDLAAARGLRCLIWEQRFDACFPGHPGSAALFDSIVADYRAHPGFLGYYMGDEPPPDIYPLLRWLHAELRARDPDHPAWNNLLGRGSYPDRAAWEGQARAYLDSTRAAVLCDDHYDFRLDGDRGLFVANAAGLAAVAREYGIPFWAIIQLVSHGPYRLLTEGELTWQVAMLLAYGARGVGYFTYWTPGPDTVWNWQPAVIARDGTRTPWYAVLQRLNPAARAVGETLATLTRRATVHAGSLPVEGAPFAPDDWIAAVHGRAALGEFVDSSGARFVLVANSDSAAARTIALTLAGGSSAWRLDTPYDRWSPLAGTPAAGGARLELPLAAGGFALLRLDDPAGGPAAGRPGPRLRLSPNPARGEVRLALARLTGRARLEILDAGGRRVWSRPLPEGSADVSWRGECASGGRAPAGLYFVRVEDARGVAVARLTWLRVAPP
jgi:hypothetical protein